ncbi:hypothetical protein PMIT1323_00004 [Prochlorococcus marinus str. MIT 1323]|nr:hypothetical protein PMIT1323_00004 [Prochlorococcus marinus str. MIT 1323]
MHPSDLACRAIELIPISDAAKSNFNRLLLGQLQIAAVVVAKGDCASHHGDLHQATLNLVNILLLHRIIRCREAHGLINEGFTTRSRANSLIVDLWPPSRGQLREPTGIDLRREGCTSSA